MQEAKLFQKYGLNAQLVYITTTKMGQAIVAGDVHISQNNGVQVVDAVMAGADSVFVGGTSNTFHFLEYLAYPQNLGPETYPAS